ncbi:DNA-directed RNA polymerase subunit omega [bacterium]|nr:MAG: DNA-directed RNA polymerase subunit omega [bacterium]RIK60828.1 MAG: DNA-directed RNA polymerase subunit omega [Planctomycetota bacterium]
MAMELKKLDYPELETLYKKTGGKYRLTVLLQRRVNELVRGAPKLIAGEQSKDFIGIALEELKQGKISLAEDNQTVVKS